MIKRKIITLIALALTGIIFLMSPMLPKSESLPSPGLPIIRVWILDDEPAVSRWLKKQAAIYEKQSGQRIYLRTASPAETEQALAGAGGAIIPDLMIMQGLESPLLCRGYALIIRDDSASILTPAPTGILFSRPSPSPGPSPSPSPDADFSSLSAVLAPDFLSASLPGIIPAADPFSDFSAGKAAAAILTAGQAALLPFGYRAHALPGEEGILPVQAQAMNETGEAFLSFLQGEAAQRQLSEYGLYSYSDTMHLYDENDPLRAMIENSRK